MVDHPYRVLPESNKLNHVLTLYNRASKILDKEIYDCLASVWFSLASQAASKGYENVKITSCTLNDPDNKLKKLLSFHNEVDVAAKLRRLSCEAVVKEIRSAKFEATIVFDSRDQVDYIEISWVKKDER